jgi:hypothetical protein
MCPWLPPTRERVCLGAKTLAAQIESCPNEKNMVGYKFGTQRHVNIDKRHLFIDT